MIATAQARHYLEVLWLDQAAESRMDAATRKELPYADFLADLLGVEAAARRERYLVMRTRLATSRSTARSPTSTSPFSRRSTSGRSRS